MGSNAFSIQVPELIELFTELASIWDRNHAMFVLFHEYS